MSENFTKEINGLKIDPQIFTFPFACKCNGECCNYGVYTDKKEAEMILSIQDKVKTMMDDSQSLDVSAWFEAPEEDEDFDSGVAVGTQIINGKCTFLDKNGLCSLQKLAYSENQHPWKYKPLYCILFPLTVWNGALTVDDEHIDRLKHCNKFPVSNATMVEYCKDELIHFLGEKGYTELIEYKNEYFESIKEGANK